MDKIVIDGGIPLKGTVPVSGAKNAALPILTASLLTDAACTWRNVPRLNDIRTMGRLLAHMGVEVTGRSTLRVDAGRLDRPEAPYGLVRTMRASVLVLGPLLARHGRARVSLPGGCAIGERPIDQHLKGLEALGATIRLRGGYVEARARKLVGARIVFDLPTVTGTENLMMAATLARGPTVLENAACEPEVVDLANVLNEMGARVRGAGTPVVRIDGVESLGGSRHRIIPDRIEAGTFMVAAAATRGDVLVQGAEPRAMEAILGKLRAAGADVRVERTGIRVQGPADVEPLDVVTQPHPGFPTDMQAQLMVLATRARGQSVITETVFENRFMHVSELRRMGADIHVDGRTAILRGPIRLQGASVMASDLRASAALVIAGLIAQGRTEVLRVYHLDRGYEGIERKLRTLGAKIRRLHGS